MPDGGQILSWLDKDPVERVYEHAKLLAGLTDRPEPSLGLLIASAGSAGEALERLGISNILSLYATHWVRLGDARCDAKQAARAEGFLMGFATGFAEALVGAYDFGRLSWTREPRDNGHTPSRALEEARRAAHNDGLDWGAHAARRLGARHRAQVIDELRAKAKGRYPRGWSEAAGFTSFIYGRMFLDRRAAA